MCFIYNRDLIANVWVASFVMMPGRIGLLRFSFAADRIKLPLICSSKHKRTKVTKGSESNRSRISIHNCFVYINYGIYSSKPFYNIHYKSKQQAQ